MTHLWPLADSACSCDHVTLQFKSFTINCYIQCMPALPFPLETFQASVSDWPPGSDPVSGSHHTMSLVKIWGLAPNYFRPGAFHYGPRALWKRRVVNHCQQHISVCLGPDCNEAFPQTLWEITSKCWQISKFAALLEIIHSCWLIIQSVCTSQLGSSSKHAAEALLGGAEPVFTDMWANRQTCTAYEDIWTICQSVICN